MNIVEEKPKEEVKIKEEEIQDEKEEPKSGIDDYIFDFDDMIVKEDVEQGQVILGHFFMTIDSFQGFDKSR